MKTTVIALALTGLIAAPAALAGTSETFPVEFELDRTQLNTQEGAQGVYTELREKIEDACDFTSSRRGLAAERIESACINDAMASAVRSMNSQTIVAVHNAAVTQEG